MNVQPALRDLRRAFGGLRRKGQRLFGILGNEAGEIAVPDRPGYQYARIERGSERVTVVCLGAVRARLNTAVLIEQNPLTEEFQIVGLDVETTRAAGDDPTTSLFAIAPHAASHEWRRDADDILLWLHPNQIYFLRVQPGETSGHVVVQGGPYFVQGQLCWKRAQSDVDLTTYYPTYGAAWVMLCLDEADAITVVQAPGGGEARDIADVDVIPTGTIALAAVKLTAGEDIDFFDDIIPLWQITQFDSSVLANGEVRITEDGLVVGTDYPGPTGPWTFIGTSLGDCGHNLHGVQMMWDSDFLSLVLIDEGVDQKAAGIIFGDNTGHDRFIIGFCNVADVLIELLEIDTSGNISVVAGATFDGVDVSAHASNPSAHHARYTDGEALAQANAAVAAHTALANPHDTGIEDLTDVPAYTGLPGRVLAVRPDGTGTEWVVVGSSGGGGTAGSDSAAQVEHVWHADGPLAVVDEVDSVYQVVEDIEITGVVIYVMSPGTSGNTVVDLEVSADGGQTWSTLYPTSARPAIVAGATDRRNSSIPDTVLLFAGDLVRMCIDYAATGARGLSVQMNGEVFMGVRFESVALLGQSISTTSDVYEITGATGWRVDCDKIPAIATVRLQARMYVNVGATIYAELYDETHSASIAGSQISTTAETVTLVESADFRAALPTGSVVLSVRIHTDGVVTGVIRAATLMIEW